MGSQDTQTNQNDVQSRLMQMLDDVRLESDSDDRPASREKTIGGRPTASETQVASKAPPVPVAKSVSRATAPKTVPNGTHCTNCDETTSWEGASWCPQCGYYPKMGRTVFDENTRFDGDEDEETPLTIEGLLAQVPLWVYIMLTGCFALLAGAIAIRIMVPDVYYRGIIGLYLAAFGLIVFGMAHFRAYLIASHDTDKINFGAIFITPVKLWSEASKKLPKVHKAFLTGAWGFSIIVFAVVVVGLDWNGLFNPEQNAKKPKFNPLKFVMQSAMTMGGAQPPPSAGGQDDLESSLGDFAGSSGAEDLAGGEDGGAADTDGGMESAMSDLAGTNGTDALIGGKEGLTSGPEASDDPEEKGDNSTSDPNADLVSVTSGTKTPLRKSPQANKSFSQDGISRPDQAEYLVVGYTTNASGELRSLLLAETKDSRPVRFKTRFQLSETNLEIIQSLEKTFSELRTPRPAIASPYSARWVKPVVVCKIAYDGISPGGTFHKGLVFDYYIVSTDSASNDGGSRK